MPAQRGQPQGAVGSVWLPQAETAIHKALIMEKQTGYLGGEEQGVEADRPTSSIPHSSFICRMVLLGLMCSFEI